LLGRRCVGVVGVRLECNDLFDHDDRLAGLVVPGGRCIGVVSLHLERDDRDVRDHRDRLALLDGRRRSAEAQRAAERVGGRAVVARPLVAALGRKRRIDVAAAHLHDAGAHQAGGGRRFGAVPGVGGRFRPGQPVEERTQVLGGNAVVVGHVPGRGVVRRRGGRGDVGVLVPVLGVERGTQRIDGRLLGRRRVGRDGLGLLAPAGRDLAFHCLVPCRVGPGVAGHRRVFGCIARLVRQAVAIEPRQFGDVLGHVLGHVVPVVRRRRRLGRSPGNGHRRGGRGNVGEGAGDRPHRGPLAGGLILDERVGGGRARHCGADAAEFRGDRFRRRLRRGVRLLVEHPRPGGGLGDGLLAQAALLAGFGWRSLFLPHHDAGIVRPGDDALLRVVLGDAGQHLGVGGRRLGSEVTILGG
jgi:hypothetical protein